MTKETENAGKAALVAAARAFARAQHKGLVWISDEGLFDTYESDGMFVPPTPPNPAQLRLA